MESSSGADLIAQNVIKSENIELDSSSGADLHVEVMAGEVSADASSGADIKVSGQADVLYADASSGSTLKRKTIVKGVTQTPAAVPTYP